MVIICLCLFCSLIVVNKLEVAQAVQTKAKSQAVPAKEKIDKKEEAKKYFKKGLLYYELEEYEKARKYFKLAIKNNKKQGIYYYNLALAYFKDGYYTKARELFDKTIKIEPKLSTRALFYQGVMSYELGELNKANDYFAAVEEKEGATNLGLSAQKMVKNIEAELRPPKDWAIFIETGTEANDNVTTEFQNTDYTDQGNYVDLNVLYRPFWCPGLAIDYVYSNLGYQKLSSANVVAQMIKIGSDLSLNPFFYYDYTYTHYWLNARPYYQSKQIKLMLNYQLIPFDLYARTGFFIVGENKYYFPEYYADYHANIYQIGVEQTLFNNLMGKGYYAQSRSKSPDNDYQAMNYSCNWYWELLTGTTFVTDWRYEYRAYYDYYGFNRQDLYQEIMFGIRQAFAEIWEVVLERRNM
ncbi:MAG: tetratricopeptide repeat protein, partial [Candidatus Margulisbacteria bacterium]|nr:tetratricopeptide repeat protein [Candidatus Margulisiibacteriota bacterium]